MSFAAGLDPLALEHVGFVVVDVIGRRTKDGVEAAIDDVVDGRFGEPFARRGATGARQGREQFESPTCLLWPMRRRGV